MPIKEFVCHHRANGEPFYFEKRFTSYEQYKEAYRNNEILCPECACAFTVISITHSRTAPPKFEGSGFYETDYKR